MTAITCYLDQLPTGFRSMTPADAEGDARHLEALISAALDKLVPLRCLAPEVREVLQSATAMLWVAPDLAKTLSGSWTGWTPTSGKNGGKSKNRRSEC